MPSLFRGDCHDLIKTLPDSSIDCLISDPPYGVTYAHWDKHLRWDELWPEIRRVLKPAGQALVFSAQPFTSALVSSNAKDFRHMWYWRKSQSTFHMRCKTQPLRVIEEICVFGRQAIKATYNPQMVPKAKSISRSTGGGLGKLYKPNPNSTRIAKPVEYTESYPTHVLEFPRDPQLVLTQKPIALLEYLVRTHTNPGDTILDLCLGSGTTAMAAKNLNRRCIGFELDPEHHEIATKRVYADGRPI